MTRRFGKAHDTEGTMLDVTFASKPSAAFPSFQEYGNRKGILRNALHHSATRLLCALRASDSPRAIITGSKCAATSIFFVITAHLMSIDPRENNGAQFKSEPAFRSTRIRRVRRGRSQSEIKARGQRNTKRKRSLIIFQRARARARAETYRRNRLQHEEEIGPISVTENLVNRGETAAIAHQPCAFEPSRAEPREPCASRQ